MPNGIPKSLHQFTSPPAAVKVPVALQPPQRLVCLHPTIFVLCWEYRGISALFCSLLSGWLKQSTTFPDVYGSLGHAFLWNFCLSFCPVLKPIRLTLLFLSICRIWILLGSYKCCIDPLLFWLPFHCFNGDCWWTEVLHFNVVQFICLFFFYGCCSLCPISETSAYSLGEECSSMLSPRCLIVLPFTLRPTIHLKLMLVHDIS